MRVLAPFLYPILFVINIITGTLIARNIAKNNEWDFSYKKAFTVIFIWMIITFSTSYIIQLVTRNLSFSETDINLSISLFTITLIISFSTFLIIGPLIVKKIYEEEFKDSLIMVIRVLSFQGFIQILCFPLYFI